MAEHNEKGTKAEKIAANYLSDHQFKILERNWKFGQKEIDIIAQDKNQIVFVEVKARSKSNAEPAGDLLSRQKMRNIVDAAEAFIYKKNIMLESRFDMVYIVFGPEGHIIDHIKEVIIPGANW